MPPRRTRDLISEARSAAIEPERLPALLDDLAAQVGAEGWHLLRWDRRAGSDELGLSSRSVQNANALRDYDAHFGPIDPRRALAASIATGIVVRCSDHFDDRYVSRNEFYQDFMRPLGLRYSIGVGLHRDEAVDIQLGLFRGARPGPFDDRQRGRLQAFTAPFADAMRRAEMARRLELRAACAEQGLAVAGAAVLGLTRVGRLVYASAFAESLLRSGRPIELDHGSVRPVVTADRARFHEALRALRDSDQPRTLRIGGDLAEGEAWCVVLYRVSRAHRSMRQHLDRGSDDVLLCVLTPLPRRRVATVRQLIAVFALGAAEARLARALGSGESLADYARAAGIAMATVKSQLRSVFAKTGTSRQSDLVRLLASVPAARDERSNTAASA